MMDTAPSELPESAELSELLPPQAVRLRSDARVRTSAMSFFMMFSFFFDFGLCFFYRYQCQRLEGFSRSGSRVTNTSAEPCGVSLAANTSSLVDATPSSSQSY